ncbi:hypothetical protein V1478_012613 [Vespula squamosa]|uniref:Uncharacterized protein n=1 Tax=Vespula squamosa TaxID=30214 RepID=A0ABD2A8F1_VESSQ
MFPIRKWNNQSHKALPLVGRPIHVPQRLVEGRCTSVKCPRKRTICKSCLIQYSRELTKNFIPWSISYRFPLSMRKRPLNRVSGSASSDDGSKSGIRDGGSRELAEKCMSKIRMQRLSYVTSSHDSGTESFNGELTKG